MLTKERLIRLCRARDQLRDTDGALSIDEIASDAALSRYHFIRQFKAVFGETPVQYRTRMRLDCAKRLLVEENHSITDICMMVGFSSLGSFSALFSQRFGRPPSAFRKALTGSGESLSPGCITLMNAAQTHNSQILRSDDPTEPVEIG
ncbi:MAG: helix-turn-helix transcriptional regulator [Pseudomonadota bacterium]